MSKWEILLHDDFSAELDQLPWAVHKRVFGYIWHRFGKEGPVLRGPSTKSLHGSRHGDKLKEIKFYGRDGGWRIAFGIDEPNQTIILLAARDKSGINQRRFYDRLIKLADQRLDEYFHQQSARRGPLT